MIVRIKKMSLENFKGIRQRVIDFENNVHNIEGKNASGKTTIATAYYWVFCNTDYELRSNPAIFPVDAEECTPSVEIEMNIDDKPMKICKKQSRRITESNGIKKITLTNNYFVNDVPMAERDMVKKLNEAGFDLEKYDVLANPNAFLTEKKDEQRKILFSMVSSITDLDIAKTMNGVDEAADLLNSYTAGEIRAMENATLKKITENYGKKGEILNARIEGLENAKVDMDFTELEIRKNVLTKQLEENREARKVLAVYKDKEERIEAINRDISGWENEMNEIKRKIKEAAEEKADIEATLNEADLPDISELEAEGSGITEQIRDCDIKLSKAEDNSRIDGQIEDLRKLQTKYEQKRADAEKILYQLDLIQKQMNMVLTDEINKHFKLVHWKLFDYLKNGAYVETCIPMIGDKELGAALNNAMQVRAKIDICDSLQSFYNLHYPVFLDNSEALDSENKKQLAADTQLVLLTVKD